MWSLSSIDQLCQFRIEGLGMRYDAIDTYDFTYYGGHLRCAEVANVTSCKQDTRSKQLALHLRSYTGQLVIRAAGVSCLSCTIFTCVCYSSNLLVYVSLVVPDSLEAVAHAARRSEATMAADVLDTGQGAYGDCPIVGQT